jgi:KaiC/GvpD/RAD55 family RecA-like ATPase
MAGGLVRGSSTLVVGERGAGETLLGLQFAPQDACPNQPSLFVSFRETTEHLLHKAMLFQWGEQLRRTLAGSALIVPRTPPIELRPDVLAGSLLTLLDETQAQRLVLDEIGEIAHAFTAEGYAHRFHDFLAALIETLRLRGITALLTHQVAARRRTALEQQLGPSATLTENLLSLRHRPGDAHTDRALDFPQPSPADPSDLWHRVTMQVPDVIAVTDQQDGRQEPAGRKMRATGDGAVIGTHGAASQPPHDSDEEEAP